MSSEPSQNADPEAAAALLGTPVDPSPAMQGKRRSDYLDEAPGDKTGVSLKAAGIVTRMQRRQRMRNVAVGFALATLVVLVLLQFL